MGRLVYQTLRENVADAIRMKILNHEVPMGARIIEQEIAAELGVSRGPAGEAGIYPQCRLFGKKNHIGGYLRNLFAAGNL